MKRISGIIGLCLLLNQVIVAQSGINSVYSAYGIGDVQIRDYNGYNSMGGLGVALPSVTTLNDLNPASYGYLPGNRVMMELSFGGKSLQYVNSTQSISAGDFTVQKAAMGISLFKNLGTSFGIKKYSTIEYLTTGNRYLIGTDSKLSSKIEGNGGLNQFFLSNGFKAGKHLSFGVTVSLLSGSVNRQEEIATTESEGINVEKNVYYSNFVFNTGMMYKFKTGKLNWIAGATWQPQRTLNRSEDNLIKDLAGTTLVKEDAKQGKFNYPTQWSAGLTMIKDQWKFGVDYIGQDWSKVNYKGDGFTTTSSGNWAAGFSYSRPRKTVFGVIDGPTFSAGVTRDQSYLVINGEQISSWAGTAGFSLPSKSSFYHYHFALKVGQRGKSTYPLVKEKFVEFNFNVSLASFIYKGGRKYE